MAEVLLGQQLTANATATAQGVATRLAIAGASASATASAITIAPKLIKYGKGKASAKATASGRAFRLKTGAAMATAGATAEAFYTDRDVLHIMKDYLPRYYDDIYEVMAVMETEANEIKRLRAHIQRLFDQYFVNSADYALDRWERVLGITTVEGRSPALRRQYINAKLRGSGTTTLGSLKTVIDSFYSSEVTENNSENKLGIKFIGKRGEPENINDIIEAVNDVIPAHIEPDYQFTYLPWNEVEQVGMSWNEAETYTAHDLERTFLIGEEG